MEKINHCHNHNRFIAIDCEELTGLELIHKVVDKSNEIVDKTNEIELNQKQKVSHADMKEIYKHNDSDFVGSWHGIKHPVFVEGGQDAVILNNVERITTLETTCYNIKEYSHLVTNNNWTEAFKQCAIDISKNDSKSKKLYIPYGEYLVDEQIQFNNIWSLKIEGDNANSTRVIGKGIPNTQAIFDIRPGDFTGGALTGLHIKDIWFDFNSTGCHGIKTYSLNDNCIFENLHFRGVGGSAINVRTRVQGTDNYNFIEGAIFRNVVIIGVGKNTLSSSSPLIHIHGDGGANEIYFELCKFYMNPDIKDITQMNQRQAIRSECYSHGWSITKNHFLGTCASNVISFGKDYYTNELLNSNSHRVYDNSFENIHDTDIQGCLVYMNDSDKGMSNTQNYIGNNRFEEVHTKYYYKIETNNTTVFETGVLPQQVQTGGFKNNIMCFKSSQAKENYYNAFMQSNGVGYNVSSNLTICNRGDIDSNGIKELKPSLIMGYKENNETLKEHHKIELRNDFYQDGIVDYYVSDKKIFTLFNGQLILNGYDMNEASNDAGAIVFDKATKQFKGYNGTTWVVLG